VKKIVTGEGCWSFFSPTRKEERYSEQTMDLFNIFPTNLNTGLTRYSNFCKWLKKENQRVALPNMIPRQQWRPIRKKNGDLSIVFSVHGTGGTPTGPDPEIMVSDQDNGNPGRPLSCGLQVPTEPGQFRARTNQLGDLPAAFFLQTFRYLHQQR